jgi:oligopeptidase B
VPAAPVGAGIERLTRAFVLAADPVADLGGVTVFEPAVRIGDADPVEVVDDRVAARRDGFQAQPRPMFGRLPWLALERRIFALRFFVFLDMAIEPTGARSGLARCGGAAPVPCSAVQAPVAPRVPHTWQRPTGPVDDPWAWLADRDDPNTIAYLEAENAYADAWFAPHQPLVEELFAEIKSRIQETDLSAPVRNHGWWYVTRTEEGRSYPTHCRGRSEATATDEVLLDENAEAAGHDYFSLQLFDVSPDQSLLAWACDIDGSERLTLRIRDLATGVDADDLLTGVSWAGTAWSTDGRHLFYVTYDEAMRPWQVWRHRLGTPQSDDVAVFEEQDERFFVGVELTRSEQWIVIDSSSRTSSEARLVPAAAPETDPVVVRVRAEDLEYAVDHWGDRFVVLTNLDAVDFRVMAAPADAPGQWDELVAHVEGRRIAAAEAFADHLVLHEWADAQQRLRIVGRDLSEQVLDLGGEPHEVELDANPEWTARTVRFRYQSFTTPASVEEIDLDTGIRRLLKQVPVPGTDLSRYSSRREWALAEDGTRVPVDVLHLAGTEPDGTAPCLVYGYGSYEISMPPWFSVARLSLVDRGWTWALVHPRGGGELGRRWYLDGKLEHKQRTFDDVIAAAEHLMATGRAAPDRMVLRGGSAGGLLVGAVINQRPDLFAGAVAEVPFVDVVTTMSDPTLPLTITEWEEWGDPRGPDFERLMAAYSPYDNVRAAPYPALFVTAGLNDPRVSYHEPAKWVAKLRATSTGDAPILLRTELDAGHGGPSGRYDAWRDEARTLAFVLWCMGLAD